SSVGGVRSPSIDQSALFLMAMSQYGIGIALARPRRLLVKDRAIERLEVERRDRRRREAAGRGVRWGGLPHDLRLRRAGAERQQRDRRHLLLHKGRVAARQRVEPLDAARLVGGPQTALDRARQGLGARLEFALE